MSEDNKTEIELINTNLRRYTFENKKMKKWVEYNCDGLVLNLFAGKTKLEKLIEVRVDIDEKVNPDFCMDALKYIETKDGPQFDTIILDPPYSYRKAMEMYKGNYTSKFKLIADNIENKLAPNGKIISFGYHSTFMGKKRGYKLDKMCVFAHGGAQHCTIAIVESRIETPKEPYETINELNREL